MFSCVEHKAFYFLVLGNTIYKKVLTEKGGI